MVVFFARSRLAPLGLVLALCCACAAEQPLPKQRGGDDNTNPVDNRETPDNPDLQRLMKAACSPHCKDFPAEPLFDDDMGSAPPRDAARFRRRG